MPAPHKVGLAGRGRYVRRPHRHKFAVERAPLTHAPWRPRRPGLANQREYAFTETTETCTWLPRHFFVICFNYRMRRAKASLAYPLPGVCAPFTPALSARPPPTHPTRSWVVTFLFSPIFISSRLFLTFPLFSQYEAPPKLLLLPPCPPLSLRM